MSVLGSVMCTRVVYAGLVENVKEVLKLTVENKNGVVPSGELTVILDGLAIDQEPLHNGNAATTTTSECFFIRLSAFFFSFFFFRLFHEVLFKLVWCVFSKRSSAERRCYSRERGGKWTSSEQVWGQARG